MSRISIHALFAEGDHLICADPVFVHIISIHALFAEGDGGGGANGGNGAISIHALFAEGDMVTPATLFTGSVFLSTPSSQRATLVIWYEALPYQVFLSTPSSQRATIFNQQMG